MNELFGNVKKASVLNVFYNSLSKTSTTRSALSDETGLSFVTTSKITDALVELGILKQSHTYDRIQKRRSRVLSVKHNYWIGVYTISKDFYKFQILTLDLKCIHSFKFIPENSVFIDESIKMFFKRSELFALKHVKEHFCVGCAVLVPGKYDSELDSIIDSEIPHLNSARLSSTIQKYTFGKTPCISSVYTAYTDELKYNLVDDESVFALFLNQQSIKSAYVCSKTVSEIPVSNIGNLKSSSQKSLDSFTKNKPDPDLFFNDISEIIFTLYHTIPITKITLSGSLYSRLEDSAKVLQDYLTIKFNEIGKIPPPVSSIDCEKYAAISISREIRNNWFVKDIMGENSP